jgi:hypothetical protein
MKGSIRSFPLDAEASSAKADFSWDCSGGFAASSIKKRVIGLFAATITGYPALAISIIRLGDDPNGSRITPLPGEYLFNHSVATPAGIGGRYLLSG